LKFLRALRQVLNEGDALLLVRFEKGQGRAGGRLQRRARGDGRFLIWNVLERINGSLVANLTCAPLPTARFTTKRRARRDLHREHTPTNGGYQQARHASAVR